VTEEIDAEALVGERPRGEAGRRGVMEVALLEDEAARGTLMEEA
jgi:hypothetical protein